MTKRCSGCGHVLAIHYCDKCKTTDTEFCHHCHKINHPLIAKIRYAHLLTGTFITLICFSGAIII